MKPLQKGLTLIEMVIAISLLAIMISAIVFSFDGSKSRAQVLVAAMNEYAGALERMKTDTSCYPRKLAGLFDRGAVETSANSFCGADLSKQWNGPYVKAAPADTDGKVILAQISPDIKLSIVQQTSNFGGTTGSSIVTNKWYLLAEGVPSEIALQAVIACNGVDNANATTGGGTVGGVPKCARNGDDIAPWRVTGLTLGNVTDPLQNLYLLFNETRR